MNKLRKPNRHWNLDNCKESAKNYQTRGAWQKGEEAAYSAAHSKGWLEECCGHMICGHKLNGIDRRIWTKENCIESAKKYDSISSWIETDAGAYVRARKEGWFAECIKYINIKNKKKKAAVLKVRTARILKDCIKDAKQYDTIAEWRRNNSALYTQAKKYKLIKQCTGHMRDGNLVYSEKCYQAGYTRAKNSALRFSGRKLWSDACGGDYAWAQKNGKLDELCAHMPLLWEQKWDLAACIKETKQFASRGEWKRFSSGSYASATSNGWLEECAKHMTATLSFGERVICKFLTSCDIVHIPQKRFDNAEVKACRFDFYLVKENLIIEYHGEQHNPNCQQKNSTFWADNNLGKRLKADAIKKEFCRKNKISYMAIHDWEISSATEIIDLVKKRISEIHQRKGTSRPSFVERKLTEEEEFSCNSTTKWTEKTILADAKKYPTQESWRRGSLGAVSAARKLGIVKECTAHMQVVKQSYKAYTQADWAKIAKKYSTKREWRKEDSKTYSYASAYLPDVFKKITKHMTVLIQPDGYWTEERLLKSARKYPTRKAWRAKANNAYSRAFATGLLDKCTAHMQTINTYWTDEDLLADARRFNTIGEWRENSKGYDTAKHRYTRYKSDEAQYERCIAHMKHPRKRLPWTVEEIKASAMEFKKDGHTYGEWAKANQGAYMKISKTGGWFNEVRALFN